MHQKDNCHKDRGPTVNKAIIVSRHVGRRYPTTNQRNTKMIVIMIILIIVIIVIIINIIMSMGLPNTPSRSKHAGGNHPTHTTPQGGKGGEPPKPTPEPHHTTPQGVGKQPGGEGSNPQPHHTTGGRGGGEPLGGGGGGGRGGVGRTGIIYTLDPQMLQPPQFASRAMPSDEALWQTCSQVQ